MVKVSEIKDRESLEEWLLDRPEDETKKFAVSIAHRTAMQSLPVFWEWAEISSVKTKREKRLVILLVLRCNLISSVAWKMSGGSLITAAATPVSEVFFTEAPDAPAASGAASIVSILSLMATLVSASAAVSSAVDGPASVATIFPDPTYYWRQVQKDCSALETDNSLSQNSLWNGNDNPFQEDWEALRDSLPPDWSFWINWYQDALEGREPDWDMLYEIALIPDEDWEKGPVHINNEVIAGIVEKYRLLRDVQALRKELAAVRQTAIAPIGHNNPPEGIDTEAEVVTQTEIIWAALEEAEEELSKPEPSPSVLKRVGTVILRAIAEVGKYGAKLGDVGLKATAATVGGGLGAYLISKGPEIQSIAERISEFVWP